MKREEVANQLKAFDPEIYTLLEDERQRQRYTLSLLPNMNAMSPFAKYLEGSILTNSVYERSNKATSLGLRLTSIVCARAKELFHSDQCHRPSREHRLRLARRVPSAPQPRRYGPVVQPAQAGPCRRALLYLRKLRH